MTEHARANNPRSATIVADHPVGEAQGQRPRKRSQQAVSDGVIVEIERSHGGVARVNPDVFEPYQEQERPDQVELMDGYQKRPKRGFWGQALGREPHSDVANEHRSSGRWLGG